MAVTIPVYNVCEADFPNDIDMNLGKLKICTYCDAYKFPGETDEQCCNKGKIKLPIPQDPPQPLYNYIKDDKKFKANARHLNNVLSFASIGFDKEIFQRGWTPNVKIQGKIYHLISNLTPIEGEPRKFAQIYFHDSDIEAAEAELDRRMEISKSDVINKDQMKKLQEMIHKHNTYASSFQALYMLPKETVEERRFVLHKNKKPTEKQNQNYGLPTANEIALIMLNDSVESADIVLHLKEGGIKRISELNRCFDPLHYVLLFPYGEDGWHVDILQNQTQHKRMTTLMFYRYKLHWRSNQFNALLRCGKLTQEYICGMFYKIEKFKLQWVKLHQKEVKAEKYSGLLDAVAMGNVKQSTFEISI